MGNWRLLEHTADLAIEAQGATEAEAVEALFLGLLEQITDRATVRPRGRFSIEAEGMDRPETLVSALGELLYRVNVDGWLFAEIRVSRVDENHLEMEAWGEPRDPARHPFELEIKAATYHEFHSGPDPTGASWTIRMIFDV